MTETQQNHAMEFEGKTVEASVEAGLRVMGISREQAEIVVVDKGTRGFLGLGARPARVQIRARGGTVPVIWEMTRDLLGRMGVEAEVTVGKTGNRVEVQIESADSDGLLIGRRGEALAALQHILTRMASRRLDARVDRIRVDVAGYRQRRERHLQELARSLAERAVRTGRRAMTEPLPPAERRDVHRALADYPGVETHAAGSGINKRVVLVPLRRQRAKEASEGRTR